MRIKTSLRPWVILWILVGLGTFSLSSKTRLKTGHMCAKEAVIVAAQGGVSSYPATSEVHCAILAFQSRALSYEFAGGNCEMTGAGGAPIASEANFVTLPEALEVAQGKDTYASPQLNGRNDRRSALANNGIQTTENMYESFAGGHRWWAVDLGSSYVIRRVTILTRQNCCQSRLRDLEIRVGDDRLEDDFSSWTLVGTYTGPYQAGDGLVVCTNNNDAHGRYLSIKKVVEDNKQLQLNEVKVYGYPVV